MYEYKKLKFCPKCSNSLVKKSILSRKRLVCSFCGYIVYHNSYPASSAILLNENQEILFLRRSYDPWKGYWSLPGGYVEYEESFERAIRREVFEETGLKVRITKLVGVYLFKSNPLTNVLGPTYEVEVIDGKLNINNEESSDVKFFRTDKLPKKIAFKEQLKAISDWKKSNGR